MVWVVGSSAPDKNVGIAFLRRARRRIHCLPRGEGCVYVEGFLGARNVSNHAYKYISHFVFELYKIHLNHKKANQFKNY
jgi:hypothetical protein